MDDLSEKLSGILSDPEAMRDILAQRIEQAHIRRMVVTMGAKGSVYAERGGECGICPAHEVGVVDTTGAGDAFFAGVAIGLTYGKTLAQSCVIGTRLSASVIVTEESVCPRFMPAEFGIEVVR